MPEPHRCPACGTPADAVDATYHLPLAARKRLRDDVALVRRELRSASDGEALAAAVRIAARELNQADDPARIALTD